MAGMRAVHKKNGTTFKFSGDLKEAIEKAEKELKEKEGTTQWLFLKWQYDNDYKALYDQAGNSIAVPIFESIFRKIILHEVA